MIALLFVLMIIPVALAAAASTRDLGEIFYITMAGSAAGAVLVLLWSRWLHRVDPAVKASMAWIDKAPVPADSPDGDGPGASGATDSWGLLNSAAPFAAAAKPEAEHVDA